jgi:zona occludens toxin
MAINAYTGLMGSGKSYEVVSEVITRAIAAGRRVVTNVDDISSEKIREYVSEKFKLDMDNLGHIIHCKNDDVLDKNFFPFGDTLTKTFCESGDLICIDEAWRFFSQKNRIPKNHEIFFREHRHYTNPTTGVSCDLVLMVQDISDLNRFLKSVVELSFRTTKLKTLGMHKSYRVESFEGYRQSIKTRISIQVRKYDPKIFPLYGSYAGTGSGKELVVDKRGSIFNSKSWLILGVLGLLVTIFAGNHMLKFFHPDKPKIDKTSKTVDGNPFPSSTVPVASGPTPSNYRIVGKWSTKTQIYYLLRDTSSGELVTVLPSQVRRNGPLISVMLDGSKVTPYSGSMASDKSFMAPPASAVAPQPFSTK